MLKDGSRVSPEEGIFLSLVLLSHFNPVCIKESEEAQFLVISCSSVSNLPLLQSNPEILALQKNNSLLKSIFHLSECTPCLCQYFSYQADSVVNTPEYLDFLNAFSSSVEHHFTSAFSNSIPRSLLFPSLPSLFTSHLPFSTRHSLPESSELVAKLQTLSPLSFPVPEFVAAPRIPPPFSGIRMILLICFFLLLRSQSIRFGFSHFAHNIPSAQIFRHLSSSSVTFSV